jgi:hypothetical protein
VSPLLLLKCYTFCLFIWHFLLLCLSLSIQDVAARIPWTRWLQRAGVFVFFLFTLLEAGKSKTEALADSVSGEGLFHRQLSSHYVLIWQKGQASSLGPLLQWNYSHSCGLHPHDVITPKALPFNMWILRRHKYFVHIAPQTPMGRGLCHCAHCWFSRMISVVILYSTDILRPCSPLLSFVCSLPFFELCLWFHCKFK